MQRDLHVCVRHFFDVKRLWLSFNQLPWCKQGIMVLFLPSDFLLNNLVAQGTNCDFPHPLTNGPVYFKSEQ